MKTPPRLRNRPARRAASRGVAALIVVMVLFFVVSLVAAYTNRNLVFEQRTSANQYRSTQSAEIAMAGLNWAIAMLNGSRIDDLCLPSTDLAKTTFRQRYLITDASTGIVTPQTKLPSGDVLYAACLLDGTNWNCSCPDNGDPAPAAPTGAGMHPAFQVRFFRDPAASAALPPGMIRLDSVACPTFDAACLAINNVNSTEGRIVVSTLVALQSGLKTPPAAAITARTNIDVGVSALQAYNADVASGGVALQLGGSVSAATKGAMTYAGPPGTPASFALVELDPTLSGLTTVGAVLPTFGDRMFATVFGLKPGTYAGQPGLTRLICPCSAQNLRDALAASPLRPIWAEGDVDIDSVGDIGSAADPILVVATGNITFSTAGVTVYGALYSRSASWATAGSGTIRGAVIAENDISGTGAWTVVYDPAVLNALRIRYGSFVGLPGAWKDYTPL
ncbi:MAG: fimbrial assembly protein [Rubrivivax sp.]